MNISYRLKRIEKEIESMKLDSKPRFFGSHEEYEDAYKNGLINANDVCFIEDIPDVD